MVGVDGSNASKEALRWAADEARRTGAGLEVVMAWENPYPHMWIPSDPPGTDRLNLTRKAVERIATAELGEHPDLQVQTCGLEGPAAKVLVEAAAGADLLVVGSRGHGGFAGVLLGSVGLHCVSHAPCPVVVVRPKASPNR